jgi:hypothetical protein
MPAEVFMSPTSSTPEPTLAPALNWFQNPGSHPVSFIPSCVYNYMIAPITRFNIAALLWDQGESNDDGASLLWPLLITK